MNCSRLRSSAWNARFGSVVSYALFAAAFSLAGCASLPSNGPTSGQIQAAAKRPHASTVPFKIISIDSLSVDDMSEPTSPELAQLRRMAVSQQPLRSDLIRAGDTLLLSVYEVGVSLFGAGNPGAQLGLDQSLGGTSTVGAPAAGAQIIAARVDENGIIRVPYLGAIQAAGTYPETLAATLRSKLGRLSQNPDVTVNITDSVSSTVYIGGAVTKSGRYRLTASHERLLDILALAGGTPLDVNDARISITRNGQTASAPLNQIGPEDAANLRLEPGDHVVLERARPSFTVFGATDKVSQLFFDARDLSLSEAIARASGPSDSRANPRGVFLFRLERDPDNKPVAVVYHLNMLQPSSYFLAQKFRMHDKDTILFANAGTNLTQKLVSLVNQLFGPAIAVGYAVR